MHNFGGFEQIFTMGQLMDYSSFHDEIREHPEHPGMFLGLTYIRAFSASNPAPFPVLALRFALFQSQEGLLEYSFLKEFQPSQT
mmetsp:Transcript_8079/g.10923  ORF Transcript_8079/g.10923 Transcript_8079/m.10923 type:complete len:84 (+) Transcript_8079:229-480(+)